MRHRNSWDEFQWEKEIRLHEKQVARFFQGLVYCIDLPAEEASADFQLGTTAACDTVSAKTGTNPALQEWINDHDCEDDGDCTPPERHPVFFSPVDAVNQLAVQWNIISASTLRLDLVPHGMGITCAFAKLLARIADFTEPGRECAPPLLLSLGKRSLTDLKELMLMLDEITTLQKSLAPAVRSMQPRILIVREQLLCRLREIRSLS